MQLFSLGLCQLNDDGTPVINPSTQKCIETYSNVDIESFARAWTGFVFTAARGNVEEKQTSANNKIDPLRIEATYRDPFPKTDLQGGYIGDRILGKTLAGIAGNVLEWYDFAVFGYFSDILGDVFFPPHQDGHAAIIESFAVFGGAFFMRPREFS